MGGTILNSNAAKAATLHIAPNGNVTWSGNISNAGGGALNFVRDGNSTYTVNSPNTFAGSVTLTGGATTLADLGTFQNASSVTVNRATLIWNDTGVQAVSNRLSSTAPFTLNGGALQWDARSGTAGAMALGPVTLASGASLFQLNNLNGSARLTLDSIASRSTGATLHFNSAALNFTGITNLASGIGEANQVTSTPRPP